MSTSQPLSYGQAYATICPNANGRKPTDQEQKDIVELMRQSGYMSAREKVASLVPEKPKSAADVKRWTELPAVVKSKSVSKHEFLSVKVNRDAFETHLELHSKK